MEYILQAAIIISERRISSSCNVFLESGAEDVEQCMRWVETYFHNSVTEIHLIVVDRNVEFDNIDDPIQILRVQQRSFHLNKWKILFCYNKAFHLNN